MHRSCCICARWQLPHVALSPVQLSSRLENKLVGPGSYFVKTYGKKAIVNALLHVHFFSRHSTLAVPLDSLGSKSLFATVCFYPDWYSVYFTNWNHNDFTKIYSIQGGPERIQQL